MSFRQYGGINYAARNNIVKNNYTNANNLSVMTKVGQPSSIINVESGLIVNGFLDVSGNVGIGTTPSSSYTLDISGNLRVSKDALINGLTVGRGSGNVLSNTVVGSDALNLNTTGTSNVAIGFQSLLNNTTGIGNTALGYQALYLDVSGNYNTAVGTTAMYNYTASGTAYANTAIGHAAMYSNVSGLYCTAVGYRASYYQMGGYNTSLGFKALLGSSTVTSNGTSNCAIGDSALEYNITGNNNVAVGHWSLLNNTTGSNNVAIGSDSGKNYTSCSNNTYIGYNVDCTANNLSNSTAIGYNSKITANNQIMMGTSSETVNIPGKLTVTGDASFNVIPTAPTATAGTNTTQIATTAFVQSAIGSGGSNVITTVYTSSGNITLPKTVYKFDFIVIAGGGGGAPSTQTSSGNYGGGGGGGAFVTGTFSFLVNFNYSGVTIALTVGAGGAGGLGSNSGGPTNGSSGQNSQLTITQIVGSTTNTYINAIVGGGAGGSTSSTSGALGGTVIDSNYCSSNGDGKSGIPAGTNDDNTGICPINLYYGYGANGTIRSFTSSNGAGGAIIITTYS